MVRGSKEPLPPPAFTLCFLCTQATKAHVRLNTKKLYSADGYAVQEMLKVTTLLYSASRAQDAAAAGGASSSSSEAQPPVSLSDFDVNTKLGDLKVRHKLPHGALLCPRPCGRAALTVPCNAANTDAGWRDHVPRRSALRAPGRRGGATGEAMGPSIGFRYEVARAARGLD